MTEPPGRAEDDSFISGDEILYRRLSYDGGTWVLRDPVSGERSRPQSGGFDHDTDGVSVFRQAVLLELDPPLGPEAVGDVVVGFSAADVRSLRLGVRADPWPQDVPDKGHPRYAAHALVTGLDQLGRRERKRRQQDLVKVPSMKFVHG